MYAAATMDCPRDGATLEAKIYEANIEVDACPRCTGMFLDKGELEQIQATTEHDYKKALAEQPDSLDGAGDSGRFQVRRKGAVVTSVEGLAPVVR